MIRIKGGAVWMLSMAVVLWVGCAGGSQHLSDGRLGGGLLGAGGTEAPFWEDWTAQKPASMSVDDELRPYTAFDAWRIDDRQFRHQAWDAVFHMLTALAGSVDDDAARRGLESLMMRLDAGIDDIRWEAVFLSHRNGEREGVVVRIVASDGAGVWIEASRAADGSTSATRWILRAEPAAVEAGGHTVWFEERDGHWQVDIGDGAGAEAADRAIGDGVDWGARIELWHQALWLPMTGRDYVDSDIEGADDDGTDLADGWPAALGADISSRRLDDFLQDTVFPPRTPDGGIGDF